MDQLRQRLEKNVPAGIDPGLRQALSNPFAFVDANKTNPGKNLIRARKLAETQLGAGEINFMAFMLGMQKDPRHFAYGILPTDIHGTATAAMNANRKIMLLNENFDPQNALDSLFVYHETVHFMHVAAWIKRNRDEFIKFHAMPSKSNTPVVIVNEEYDAYGMEIEALDVLTNGLLRSSRNPLEHIDHCMRLLNARENQRGPLTMLLTLAGFYYPQGNVARGIVPRKFAEVVGKMCAHDGWDVYFRSPTGIQKILDGERR